MQFRPFTLFIHHTMSDSAFAAPPSLEEPRPSPLPGSASPHRRPLLRMVAEIALIASGVFLGLLADQWRERQQHREAALASLRRFRAEIVENRRAVAAVRDYHTVTLASVRSYLGKDHKTRNVADVKINGLHWVSFEHTAWDLALATQALTYIDSDLAYSLSRAYGVQQSYGDLTSGMTQAMYMLQPQENFDAFAQAIETYFGDVTYLEPRLLTMYDELLPRIDRALGAPNGRTTQPRDTLASR
jgi:hypothetical protein